MPGGPGIGSINPENTADAPNSEKNPACTPINPSYLSYPSYSLGENLLEDRTGRTGRTGCGGYKQRFFLDNDPSFGGLTQKWDRPQNELTETAGYFNALLKVPNRWIAIDIETTAPVKLGKNKKPLKTRDALNPWLGDVRLVAIRDGEEVLQLDLFEKPLAYGDVLRSFSTCGWIAHNAEFELLYLKVHFGIVPPVSFCTKIANAVLTNGRLHHGVEDEEVNEIELEVVGTGKSSKKKKQKVSSLNTLKRALIDTIGVTLPKELGDSNWGGQLSPAQLEYSRNDVLYLPPMAAKHVHLLREGGLETVAMLEMALLPVVVDMKYHGFAVDREKVAKREKIYAALSEEKADHVRSLLGSGCPKLGDNRKSGGLLDWIEKITGVRLQNMEYASLLAWGHPIGEALVDYKQHAKRWKVFRALLEHSARDGRIHATLNQMGAVTGRFSCREINLQQLENGSGLFRDCMIASGPDRVLVCADFKHIELRTACIFATAVTGIRINGYLSAR
jgi:DNA polymerase family A/3'-5' exonuclease